MELTESVKTLLRKAYPHGHQKFLDITLEELKLHNDKNFDYASGGDPLGNFDRVSVILKMYDPLPHDPEIIALIYAMKQLDQVLWSAHRGQQGKIEGSAKRLQDVSVYAKLAQIMIEEKENGTKSSSSILCSISSHNQEG